MNIMGQKIQQLKELENEFKMLIEDNYLHQDAKQIILGVNANANYMDLDNKIDYYLKCIARYKPVETTEMERGSI